MKKRATSPFAAAMHATAFSSAVLTVLFLVVFHYFHSGWILSTAITFGTLCYHISMRLLVGALVPATLSYQARWFQQRPWEPALYRRLKVKNWKKHLPTYDPDAFSLDHHTLEQILANMCQAELVHEIIAVCSFVPLLAVPALGALPVFLITSCLSAAADLVFATAQRYNRPRILRLTQKRAAHHISKEHSL